MLMDKYTPNTIAPLHRVHSKRLLQFTIPLFLSNYNFPVENMNMHSDFDSLLFFEHARKTAESEILALDLF